MSKSRKSRAALSPVADSGCDVWIIVRVVDHELVIISHASVWEVSLQAEDAPQPREISLSFLVALQGVASAEGRRDRKTRAEAQVVAIARGGHRSAKVDAAATLAELEEKGDEQKGRIEARVVADVTDSAMHPPHTLGVTQAV